MEELVLKGYFKGKTLIHNLIHEEKGASEVIATVIILGVVVVLAFAFKSKLEAMWTEVWSWISGAGTPGGKTGPDFSGVK